MTPPCHGSPELSNSTGGDVVVRPLLASDASQRCVGWPMELSSLFQTSTGALWMKVMLGSMEPPSLVWQMAGPVLESVNGPPGAVAVATERHCMLRAVSCAVYHITQVDPNLATEGAHVSGGDAQLGRLGRASLMADQ